MADTGKTLRFASPLLSMKTVLVTIQDIGDHVGLSKKLVAERMKKALAVNDGVMMDIQTNRKGDMLCYMVARGDIGSVESSFKSAIASEFPGIKMSSLSLLPFQQATMKKGMY